MIIFKMFDRFKVNTLNAIVVNYWVAATLSILLDPSGIPLEKAPIEPWFFQAIIMGFLFITLFNIIAKSTQNIGVSVTTVANKMSLIMPVMFSIIVLHDAVNVVKVIGIVLALVAVYLTTKSDNRSAVDKRYIVYPFIVFIGSGIIDTLFKYNDEFTLGENGLEPFVSWIFITSSLLGLIVLIYQFIREKSLPDKNSIIAGFILGFPNYFSIFFLLKSMNIGMEGSVVIPLNNISIVAVSALSGIFIFREKGTQSNIIGLLLAIIAIGLLAFSNEIGSVLGIG
jgi:drug/metabolite transporter (DMT)-like permease